MLLSVLALQDSSGAVGWQPSDKGWVSRTRFQFDATGQTIIEFQESYINSFRVKATNLYILNESASAIIQVALINSTVNLNPKQQLYGDVNALVQNCTIKGTQNDYCTIEFHAVLYRPNQNTGPILISK